MRNTREVEFTTSRIRFLSVTTLSNDTGRSLPRLRQTRVVVSARQRFLKPAAAQRSVEKGQPTYQGDRTIASGEARTNKRVLESHGPVLPEMSGGRHRGSERTTIILNRLARSHLRVITKAKGTEAWFRAVLAGDPPLRFVFRLGFCGSRHSSSQTFRMKR